MASNDALLEWSPLNNEPPDADFATLDTILSTSSDEPDDVYPVLDFDPGATQEFAVFSGVMPEHYGGGGITLTIKWCTEATSGNAKWDAAFKRHEDAAGNILSSTYAAVNTVTTAADGTARDVVTSDITFTDGADMDSVAKNEFFHLLITRDSVDAADTINSNDLELLYVYLTET